MLSDDQLALLWNIEVACQKCIRAAKYFDVSSGAGGKVWAFTQNCYGEICLIYWCKVFGAFSEPTHYSRLFRKGVLAEMTKEIVAERLRLALGMTSQQYRAFWGRTKHARDKYVVHDEFSAPTPPKFPDTSLLVKACLAMRAIVHEIVEVEPADDSTSHGEILQFLSHYTNERYLVEIEIDAAVLAQAISSDRRSATQLRSAGTILSGVI